MRGSKQGSGRAGGIGGNSGVFGMTARRGRGPSIGMGIGIAIASALAVMASAMAQDVNPGPARAAAPLPQGGDPALPGARRSSAPAAPEARPAGLALQRAVEAKLRRRFEAADVEGRGSVSAEEARRAGWIWLAEEFDRIDSERRGRLGFEQITRYLRARNAAR